MATVTLTKSVSGTSFSIDNTPSGSVLEYPVGSVYMSTSGDIVSLYNIYTGAPVLSRIYSEVLDGDDDEAFASVAAFQAYVIANCFVAPIA